MAIGQCMGRVPFLLRSDLIWGGGSHIVQIWSLPLPGGGGAGGGLAFWSLVLLSRSYGTAGLWLMHPAQINWQIGGFYSQGAEEPKLKWEHITTLVTSLREFVRSTDRKIIATTLSKLKLELDFDSHGISQVQVVLFGFQDAVSMLFCPCPPPPPTPAKISPKIR